MGEGCRDAGGDRWCIEAEIGVGAFGTGHGAWKKGRSVLERYLGLVVRWRPDLEMEIGSRGILRCPYKVRS